MEQSVKWCQGNLHQDTAETHLETFWRREVSLPEDQLLHQPVPCICGFGQEYAGYKAHDGTYASVLRTEPLSEALGKAVHEGDCNDPSEVLTASQAALMLWYSFDTDIE